MILHEVFASIQGEGYDTGLPTVFVRFFGCNVHCVYCDQPQKRSECRIVSVSKVVTEVRKHGIRNVCITGGEPLLQDEIYPLIYELVSLGYNVSIETNGTLPIEADNYRRSFKYIMDVKCPSSGVSEKNLYSNLANLKVNDEVKFVIKDREDYNFMKSVLIKYPTKAKILVSPMFDEKLNPLIGKEVVEWLVADKLDHIKLQLQIHKILSVL